MEYEEFSIDFAARAGDVIRKNFSIGMKREWKSDHTPVTETDKTINRMLIEEIAQHFPTHDVHGEEEKSVNNNSEYLWVCDPVDGTIPFSHGIPLCMFSLALVHVGVPIVGVTYDPFMNRLFYAEKGKGAFLNDHPIQVSTQENLFNSVLNYEWFKRAKYDISDFQKPLEEMQVKVTKFASYIYPGSLVAAGEYIADVFPHTTAHDVAALKVLVEEAGGRVTDIFGREQRYDQDIEGAIVSNGRVHDQLVEIIGGLLNVGK